MSNTTPKEWKLDFADNPTKKEYEDFFKIHPDQKHCKEAYERDVRLNPMYHPTPKRIKKMEGKELGGYYRYKKSNTKVIYFPNPTNHTVYTVETNTATNISYKKRSKR
jgi:mRNA-degrading endonuclease RelE of RelBE toxin-antitoxin system